MCGVLGGGGYLIRTVVVLVEKFSTGRCLWPVLNVVFQYRPVSRAGTKWPETPTGTKRRYLVLIGVLGRY